MIIAMIVNVSRAPEKNNTTKLKGRGVRKEPQMHHVRCEELTTHANSYRVCANAAQKDCSGCGACRMATVYRTVGIV